jgi:hypothetical protein
MAAMATLLAGSSIGRVERDILCDLPLPAVAVCEQAFLVVGKRQPMSPGYLGSAKGARMSALPQ